jgi:histidine kinase
VHGRERECAELIGAFERIARGGVELVLLAGIGKSSLPSVLQERVARTGGYLTETKFDPDLRERPFAGFASAFTAWVDQILAERSDRHRIVKVASLIGTVFEVETLVAISESNRMDVLQQLMRLTQQGLVAPCRGGFKFVHDRLREAAQSGLATDERASLHHRAARLLLEKPPAERLPAATFGLAEHLSGSLELLSVGERPGALEALFLAGKAALEKGAPGPASHYLEIARTLLSEDDWTTRTGLCFDLTLLGAEASVQLAGLRPVELHDVAYPDPR